MPVPRPSYPMFPQGVFEAEARASGIPDELAPAVAKFMRRIMDKQAVDERLNYQWIAENMGSGIVRLPWGVDGALTTGVSTEWPWFGDDDVTLTFIYAKIQATTTTSTVLEPRKNGVAIPGAGITLVSGTDVETTITLSTGFVGGDVYEIAVTTAGTGAEFLQTISEFQS